MFSTIQQAPPSLPGDYFGTIYNWNLLIPALGIIVVAVGIWVYMKQRNN